MRRAAFLLLSLASAAPGAARDKALPTCPKPGESQLFVSPVGEPFRTPQGHPYPVAAWFAGADANRDGKLTAEEMEADARRFFATLDRDRSGEIDPAEVERYENEIAPEIGIYAERGREWDRPERRFDMRYGGEMGAGRYAFLNVPEPVSSADADLNRGISLAEFVAAARRRFASIDRQGRGAIALADLPKTPAQRRAEQPCRLANAEPQSGARHRR